MSLRWMFNRLAPAGRSGRLSVLIFHRVLARPDELFPDEMHAETFAQRLEWLKRWFNLVTMAQAVRGLQDGDLPARAALITFDDGYADNLEIAAPILCRYDCPAAFFIAAGFLDGGRMWNDTVIESVRRSPLHTLDLREEGLGSYALASVAEKRAAIEALIKQLKYLPPAQRGIAVQKVAQRGQAQLPEDLMLTTPQLRALAETPGMTIGAHTMTHPILTRVTENAAREEIERSRTRLQELTQGRVSVFAYPNGRPGEDYAAEHVRIVRELGFEAAFSTAWGSAAARQDMFQIPRFSPWDRTPARFALRMAQNLRRDAMTSV